MQEVINKFWKCIEKIVYGILSGIFRILKKDLSDELFKAFMQFIKFGIVGVSNTVISYIIYIVSLFILKRLGILSEVDYIVSQFLAFVLSVLWSFYWNNKMVFTLGGGEKRTLWKALVKTYISYSFTGVFLNSILIILWVRVLGISELIAPIINLLISVPLNFVINKYWAFRGKSEKRVEENRSE